MQSQDNCNLIDKSWILSTFHDSWTIILWEKELPAIFELSDSIHRSCHTDGQINIWWANEPRRNKKPPVFGKRRRSRGTNVENYSKWPTPIWISVYWHYMYISYVTVCFNDTIKSLHFETIACQSNKLQRDHRLYTILPLTEGNTAVDAFLQFKGHSWGASETWNDTKRGVECNEHGHRAGGQTRSKTEVIVGPRPPLIQLSTDIRGSWIKGGLG